MARQSQKIGMSQAISLRSSDKTSFWQDLA
jgi:hypothetical protein